MTTKDLHMHTVYCDGHDTPEDMVLSAIDKGLDTVGISAHSYTFSTQATVCKRRMFRAILPS